MKKKVVITASVILIVAVSFAGLQCASGDKPQVREPSPPAAEESVAPPAHPPLPAMAPDFSLPIPPEATGYVIGTSSRELNHNQHALQFIAMKVINPDVSLDNFDVEITFDPRVMVIEHAYLYNGEVDNTGGIIKFSVDTSWLQSRHYGGKLPYDRWIDLGQVHFIAIGNPGDSTVLHFTITTPVENVTPIDGDIRIKPIPPGAAPYAIGMTGGDCRQEDEIPLWVSHTGVYLQVIYSEVSLGNFDVQITFDPGVIRIDDVIGDYDRLYNIEVDNTAGIIKLSVNPPQGFHPYSGYIHLGSVDFTVIGNPGDSTVLDVTITTPVESVTAIDGIIRILPIESES